MEESIATVVQTRHAGQVMFAARIFVPGRPLISTRGYTSREAAQASVRQRWPAARIVDVDTFTRERCRFQHQRPEGFLAGGLHPE